MSQSGGFNEPRFDQDDDDRGNPKPKGWSTGAKVALILGIVALILGIVCCGVVGFLGYKVSKSLTQDPVEIAAIQKSMISSIDLPANLVPSGGLDLTVNGQGIKFAAYTTGQSNEDAHMLMLMQIPGGASPADVQREMSKSMGKETDITIESTETKAITVDGTPVDFVFSKGKTKENVEVRQVTGTFEGNSGTVIVIYFTPEADWNEEATVQMLESIKK